MVTVEDLRRNQKQELVKYVLAGCHVIGLDGITIALVDLPDTKAFREFHIEFIAVTRPSDIPGMFYIYLQPGKSKETYITALSHEMVHIQQFVDGRLAISEDNKELLFDGVKYYPPYNCDQPHEQEAFARQGEIKSMIKRFVKNRH